MQRTSLGRRALLAAVPTLLGGCLGGATAGGDDASATAAGTTTGTPATTAATNEPVSTEFSRVDACPAPDAATVAVDGRTVSVEGCIRGANGCTVAVLDGATYEATADRLRVVVGTEDRRAPDEACTEAIVHLGYEVTVTFESRAPGRVTVAHDGVDGRRVVADERP